MEEQRNISDGLKRLYGENAVELEKKVVTLLEKYRTLIQVDHHQLTQEDVILITYGDSLNKEDELPLITLNNFLIQNLKGIANTVHILPFYPFTSDDGFSVTNYFQVNPDFGNWDNVAELSKNFRLMFDAVVNHISKGSHWFQEFLHDNPHYKNFFIETDKNNPELKKVFRPRALPLVHSYSTPTGKEKSVWTTFSEDQIDLNFSSPDVFLVILDVLLFYVSKGAKLIRLDAVGFLWKKLGTSCIHLPETHLIIQLYRKILEQLSPGILIITETNVPHKDNISYFGNGHNEAHMVYNFTLPPLLAFSIITQNVSKLAQWLSALELSGDKICYFNFTASHDGIGLQPVKGILDDKEIAIFEEQSKKNKGYVSYKSNEDGTQSPYEVNCTYLDLVSEPDDSAALKAKKFLLTQAVMLTIPGIPGIYIHSLLGTENDTDSVEKTGIYRKINRAKLNTDQVMKNIHQKGHLRNLIFNAYKKLLEARKKEPLFNPFLSFEVNSFNNKLLRISKRNENEEFRAIFNFSSQTQQVKINNSPSYTNILTNESHPAGPITLEPFGFCWIKNDAIN